MKRWFALTALACLGASAVTALAQAGAPVSIRTGQLTFAGLGDAAGNGALPAGERGFVPVSIRADGLAFSGTGITPEPAFAPVQTRTGSLSFTGTRSLP